MFRQTTPEFPMYMPLPDHALLQPSRWVAPQPDGKDRLIDPANLEPLDPNTPHLWLRADERLRAGYAYLRKLGGRLVVEALYSQHLFDNDLGDVQTGDFEAKMAASHAYAYEALGWTRAGQEQKLRMIRSGTAWEFIGRHTFEERMLRAIVSTGTPAFPHDVESTNMPLDRMLSQKGDSQWLYQHAAHQGPVRLFKTIRRRPGNA